MLPLLLACAGADVDLPWSAPLDAPTIPAADTADTAPSGDTGPASSGAESGGSAQVPFDAVVDVIVVGSGPAGMAAAIAAREAGAETILFERDDAAGLGVVLGGLAFGMDTRWQAEMGVEDDLELAKADWTRITGVSGDLPSVVEFLEHSAETLEWLEAHGAIVGALVAFESDAGSVPRVHDIGWPTPTGDETLLAAYDGELRTSVEVTGPALEDGAVVGVTWRDLQTGLTGATGARAVVLATGGFLRNEEHVAEVAPEVARHAYLWETNPQSDGGGLPFLEAVGAGSLAPEQIGVYTHAIQDPLFPEGEALVALGSENGILVDEAGKRFADESIADAFAMFLLLPEGPFFAVLGQGQIDDVRFMRPYYNWSNPPDEVEIFLPDDVLDLPGVEAWRADTLDELAALAGIEPMGLQDTVDAYQEIVAAGGGDPYGRDPATLSALEGPWYALRLRPGLAKNFGGVATDTWGRVLDGDGVPIPGLYAAGEVAGMVLGGGSGDGFTGSVTACYRGGIVAGGQAATYAR